MDYSNISEIKVTKKNGKIEIYRGDGIERFKKLNTVVNTTPLIKSNNKYAIQELNIKPSSGNIFDEAELMKKESGFK